VNQPEIRRARPDDLAQLCRLVADFYQVDGHEFDAARVRAALSPLLRDDQHGQVWVACADRLVGYAVVTWSYSLESGGRDCVLDELYAETPGQGVGAALLRRAIDEARSAGAAAMYLETEVPNDAARRFYGRHGFAADDSVWMHRPL